MKTYIIKENRFYNLRESIVKSRILGVLKKGEMSISEIKRATNSSNMVTHTGVKKLYDLGIVDLIEMKNTKHHPTIVRLKSNLR